MKSLIAAALLAAAPAFASDFIFSRGDDYIVITMAPCELPLPQKDVMLSAHARIGGQEFKACWAPINKELAGLIFEDGDSGMVPFAALRPLTDI